MRISKVIALDNRTNDKRIFTFGTADEGKRLATTNGGKLNNYIEFCFKEDVDCVMDVEIEFFAGQDKYSLSRLHNEDETTRSVLKKYEDDQWKVVARTHALKSEAKRS